MGRSKAWSDRCEMTFSLWEKKKKQTHLQVSMTLTSRWNQWRSRSTWPEALVLGQDAGPSARLPRPTRVPATKPAGVHKAQHSAGLLAGVKTQVGMFGQLVLRGEFEKTWHPEAKHDVHGLVCLTDLLSLLRVVTLHGGQRELHLLSSGCGCDAIGLTGEGHIWALADLRLDYRASENNTAAHFVNVQAGHVELRSLRHFVRTNRAVWRLQRKNKTKQSSVTKLTLRAQDALWTVGFSSLKKLLQWYRCKVGIWVDYWPLLINEQSMSTNVSIPGASKTILRWNLELSITLKGPVHTCPSIQIQASPNT